MNALREGANKVAAKLKAAGYEVYLAGGCVRDLLRGAAPKDYDLVTSALPDEVMKLFRRTIAVGAAFGVVRVLLDRDREYEVATYRKDVSYSDGRHPDAVHYSLSKEEDVKRRDFTINGLLMDPETDEILDFVGGRADLEKGVIRAVGDPEARFAEDRLRMLRAVRFAARFGFVIEPATMAAIRKNASAIHAVSVERIVVELRGIFASKAPELGFRLLVETGLWSSVLPFVPPDPPLGERFSRLYPAARELPDDARALVGFAIALGAAKEDRIQLEDRLRDLKLSRSDIRTIDRLVTGAQKARSALERAPLQEGSDPFSGPADPADQAVLVEIAIDEQREVFEAYLRAMFGDSDPLVLALFRIIAHLRTNPLPALPLISGADLKALGIPEGPEYKEILGAVKARVLTGKLTTKNAALEWVKGRSGLE